MIKNEDLQIGDLVKVAIAGNSEISIGVIIKVKKLLRLYDILLQKEAVTLKDIHQIYIRKV